MSKDPFHGFGVLLNPVLSRSGYPRLHICVDRWKLVGEGTGSETPLLSLDLESEQDIDDAINELIRDMESVRLDAKSKLRRLQKKPA